jgi:hypothetical protein
MFVILDAEGLCQQTEDTSYVVYTASFDRLGGASWKPIIQANAMSLQKDYPIEIAFDSFRFDVYKNIVYKNVRKYWGGPTSNSSYLADSIYYRETEMFKKAITTLGAELLVTNVQMQNILVERADLRSTRLIASDNARIQVSNTVCDTLTIIGRSSNCDLYNSKIGTLTLSHNTYTGLSLSSSSFGTLNLDHITVDSAIVFENSEILDSINLNNVTFRNPSILVDLTNLRFGKMVCKIKFVHTEPSKLKLNYEYFKLVFPDSTNQSIVEHTYKVLLDKQKEFGYTSGFKKLDVEYRNYIANRSNSIFVKFQNWLDGYWWNYGYNRERVFKHTFYYICLLTLITFLILRYLNDEIFTLENIPYVPYLKDMHSRKSPFKSKSEKIVYTTKNILSRLWFSFLYTSTIFFRLTLKNREN